MSYWLPALLLVKRLACKLVGVLMGWCRWEWRNCAVVGTCAGELGRRDMIWMFGVGGIAMLAVDDVEKETGETAREKK